MTSYQEFLTRKHATVEPSGFEVAEDALNPKLFGFQRAIVRWALQLGKAAVFADTGMGKTAMQLEWARHVASHTGKPVLILAPLAVGFQTAEEGRKFGIEVRQSKDGEDITSGIVITNYERLHQFDTSAFAGVVLDESSILKAYTGATKRKIIAAFKKTPYKLACSATPAPNDHLELGNHAEFLDVMDSNQMISRWFINDTMEAGSYRLKHHAEKDFWRWLTSWAVCISSPGDLGDEYDMPGYKLPDLNIVEHLLPAAAETIKRAQANGRLLPDTNPSSTTLHKVKRESLSDRIEKVQEIVASIDDSEPVIIWCDTNYEADALTAAFPDAVEVRGSEKPDAKEEKLRAFSEGKARMIITKPDIAGYGLNWQHCHIMIYAGIGFSFEKLYQSLKRCHRYGQERPVDAHLIYAETEGNVRLVLSTKKKAFQKMQQAMNAAMQEHGLFRDGKRLGLSKPEREQASGSNWTLYLGDCVEVTSELPDNSIHFSCYSPPFSQLYIYSDSEADMGNSASDEEFYAHYEFLIKELYRITLPGRLSAVHCKDLPAYMNRDGAAGLRDFPGDIIRLHEKHGWQYHSRVTIWKDPVIEMQRTKNHGLLHKNFTQRAEACRQGMPDYLIVFRKWPIDEGIEVKQRREIGDYVGTNPPKSHEYMKRVVLSENIETGELSEETTMNPQAQRDYSIAVWQRYASPVWFDIDQTNVLNYQVAKTNEDEKHICPLQLDVIERSIDLWTNRGETVFTPFAGIGSELVSAIKMGRKAIGVELKRSYYEWAIRYCRDAEMKAAQPTLFDLLEPDEEVQRV